MIEHKIMWARGNANESLRFCKVINLPFRIVTGDWFAIQKGYSIACKTVIISDEPPIEVWLQTVDFDSGSISKTTEKMLELGWKKVR
tara:strand:- start:191 stop:451 length:261 start_codon:yes stop_codon:yes gene_type:complete